jgi:chemotaxis protein MotB
MKRNIPYLIVGSIVLSIYACVPLRRMEEEQSKRKTCDTELASCKTDKESLEAKLKETSRSLDDNQKQVAGLARDTSILGISYRATTARYDKLNLINEELLRKYNLLLEGNANDTKKINGELQVTQEQVLKKQDQLKQMESVLNGQKKRDARVAELEFVLKSKDEAVNNLKKMLSDALLGFEGKGLTITQKNGKVYVSMDESLLFASGSTNVESKGADALKKLAKVLEQNQDINVLIEGHTDDVPMIGKGEIKDNWDLSVMRATSIVKIIIKNSKIDPKRLSAAGRGEYFPLDSAKTPEARKKNRRTEIILTPKLDELFKVLNTN